MHAAAVGVLAAVGPGQRPQSVRELDLAATAGLGLPQHVEDRRVADVPADDDPVRRRVADGWLLHQVGNDDHVICVGWLDGGDAVGGDLLRLDFHQGHDAAAILAPDLEHARPAGYRGGR